MLAVVSLPGRFEEPFEAFQHLFGQKRFDDRDDLFHTRATRFVVNQLKKFSPNQFMAGVVCTSMSPLTFV